MPVALSVPVAEESLESLRSRAAALRERLSQLQQAPLLPLPASLPLPRLDRPIQLPTEQDKAFLPPITQLDLDRLEQSLRGHRILGRSLFEIELARGQWSKRVHLEKDKGKGKEEREYVKKGIVLRLETFAQKTYFEPFYIVFGLQQDGSYLIQHHTVPSFIPLRQLVLDYLSIPIKDDLEIDQKSTELDLDLFIHHLQAYLNAFVSRRQQAHELISKFATAQKGSLNFRLFKTTSLDRLSIEWDIQSSTPDEGTRIKMEVVWDLKRDKVSRSDVVLKCIKTDIEKEEEEEIGLSIEETRGKKLDREGESLVALIEDCIAHTTSDEWSIPS